MKNRVRVSSVRVCVSMVHVRSIESRSHCVCVCVCLCEPVLLSIAGDGRGRFVCDYYYSCEVISKSLAVTVGKRVFRLCRLLIVVREQCGLVRSSIHSHSVCARLNSWYGPQIRRDYPLNLSILLSGGKETNQDSLSSGERSGMRPR